jgi:hypothetical protein
MSKSWAAGMGVIGMRGRMGPVQSGGLRERRLKRCGYSLAATTGFGYLP